MYLVLEKIVFKISIETHFKWLDGFLPVDGICEAKFGSLLNRYRIFRCKINFNNPVAIVGNCQATMSENVLCMKSENTIR